MAIKKISIRKTQNGRGLFANKDFKKGKTLFKVKGILFPVAKEKKFDSKTKANSIRYSQEQYLNPAGELADFLNHSCDPNCAIKKIEKNLYIFAIKNIFAGSEITIDYSTIIAKDDSWKMKCNCYSKNCRKIIRKFNSLPKIFQKKYKNIEAVPDYILQN